MELKDYQLRVLEDLTEYLEKLGQTRDLFDAFKSYWAEKGVTKMPAYKNNLPGVPHVCVKVPTAGGKTFIAANAIERVFRALEQFNPQRPSFVVWLVPSLTILEQTVRNLSNPAHPYRQRLNQLFRNRVTIYEKRDLLIGAGFSPDTVKDQLSIVVMTFDSLRARNKEDRKVYQENGYLSPFVPLGERTGSLLPDYDASSLINVIRGLRPVVIVDESHNAETQLSVEMLQNLNPDFVFDLTATPRNNSNIISFVDSLSLKKRHMVKLPVIVANRSSRGEAIESALILRRQLENIAKEERKSGGNYIRPIVLFQAQPKTDEGNTTFEKIREKLISLRIPAEQIAIKTADINELKNVDLMSSDCPIRFIITVNALKEGWDCPFAYILVSLADKTSAVDVEQIVGRILRVPYVHSHGNDLLNMSYVFTASNRFMDTLQSVVRGLNRAGFSDKDYRAVDVSTIVGHEAEAQSEKVFLNLFNHEGSQETNQSSHDEGKVTESEPATDTMDDLDDVDSSWDVDKRIQRAAGASGNEFVDDLTQEAIRQNMEFNNRASSEEEQVPPELEDKMNRYRVKDLNLDEVHQMELPQFFLKVQTGGWFHDDNALQLFESEELLRDFKLAQADANVRFDDIDTEMYRVDLEQVGNDDYSPKPFKIRAQERERLNQFILSIPRSGQVRQVTNRIVTLIGNMYPITDYEITRYVTRIIETLSPEQIRDCLDRDVAYVRKIKMKIRDLASQHSLRTFRDWLDVERIVVQPSFRLPDIITPSAPSGAIPKSLYVTEGYMGNFEQRIINEIANLDSVEWWHRNLSRGKGFRINGFRNHYPDFVIRTKAGHIIALETKGDDRDNSDSEEKLLLGKLWESKSGSKYRYMMVFDHNAIQGAEKLVDAISKISML